MATVWTVRRGQPKTGVQMRLTMTGMSRAAFGSAAELVAMDETLVSDAMAPAPQRIAPWVSVADAVAGPLRNTNHKPLAVCDGSGQVLGLVSMSDLCRLSAEFWATTPVGRLLDTARRPVEVAADELLGDAVRRVGESIRGCVVVTRSGDMVGVLGIEQVRRAVQELRREQRLVPTG